MTFEEFCKQVQNAQLTVALVSDDRPQLGVDVQIDRPGISLAKKMPGNLSGSTKDSVVQLVQCADLSGVLSEFGEIQGLGDLASRFSWKIEDASPDSVVGVLFLAARLGGVDMPSGVCSKWEEIITSWELTGVVEDPDTSWPVLASALAHTVLGTSGRVDTSDAQLSKAWSLVSAFAAEGLLAGWDPGNIPDTATGEMLHRARAALDEERARYQRKLRAQQTCQLLLPMVGDTRRRLVDVIITQEEEFSGALKVFVRNDRKNSPLGRGFTVLALVRPGLKEASPQNWVTVSLDTRANVHLLDFWKCIEKMETSAWVAANVPRPERHKDSREMANVPLEMQPFDQMWFVTGNHSLVASPKPVEISDGHVSKQQGSFLELDTVLDALFLQYDPFSAPDQMVVDVRDGVRKRLPDVEAESATGGKLVFSALWSPEAPLPNPSSDIPLGGLMPTAVRAMAARTVGIRPDRVIQDAPDIEEAQFVSFGNGLAIVTDGGAFLLDAGRRRPAQLEEARKLVVSMANVGVKLDTIQKKVATRADEQVVELSSFKGTKTWLDHQKFCTGLHAELIRIRSVLDQPLKTEMAGLQSLKDAISDRWNIRNRIQELASEIQSLQQNGRAAEELRAFRVAKFVGGLAFALVAADALASRLMPLVRDYYANLWPASPTPGDNIIEIMLFFLILLASPFLMLILVAFRARITDKN